MNLVNQLVVAKRILAREEVADACGHVTRVRCTSSASSARRSTKRTARRHHVPVWDIARSLIDVVRLSVYLPRNARVQQRAMQLGGIKPLSTGEIEARLSGDQPESPETQRAWRYWASRAGCASMLDDPA